MIKKAPYFFEYFEEASVYKIIFVTIDTLCALNDNFKIHSIPTPPRLSSI